MKITFVEHLGCFAFDLEAETLADSALLARAAMNTTVVTTTFSEQGKVDATIVIQKPKENRRTSYLSRHNFNSRP